MSINAEHLLNIAGLILYPYLTDNTLTEYVFTENFTQCQKNVSYIQHICDLFSIQSLNKINKNDILYTVS